MNSWSISSFPVFILFIVIALSSISSYVTLYLVIKSVFRCSSFLNLLLYYVPHTSNIPSRSFLISSYASYMYHSSFFLSLFSPLIKTCFIVFFISFSFHYLLLFLFRNDNGNNKKRYSQEQGYMEPMQNNRCCEMYMRKKNRMTTSKKPIVTM